MTLPSSTNPLLNALERVSIPDMSHVMENISKAGNQAAQMRAEQRDAILNLSKHADANLASEYCRIIDMAIKEFDKTLNQEEEVGVRLVSFGQTVTFHAKRVTPLNPSMLMFSGKTDDGKPIHLIQHVSQLSFLLTGLPKLDPNKPKQPYGFNRPPTEGSGNGEETKG